MNRTPDSNTNEIALLQESVREFCSRKRDHKRTRALRSSLPGFDPAVAGQMAELGWLGILIDEKHGGFGLGFAGMRVVAEELGRHLLAEPIVATNVLAGRALCHGDNEPLKDELLPRIADGTVMAALAWQEENGGIDLEKIAMTAHRADGGLRLSGRKRFVAGGAAAHGFLVTARLEGDVGLFWIDVANPRCQVSHEWRADGTPSTVLSLQNAEVPNDHVVARTSAGVQRAIDEATVIASSELLGITRELLATTIEYVRTRVQYGRPIGSFQALQHRVVDLYVQQELSHAVVTDAVAALDADASAYERSRLASRAKARCSEASLLIGRDAVQLHGAIGFTDECDVGLYLKRALVLSAWLGNADVHRRRFLSLGHAANAA